MKSIDNARRLLEKLAESEEFRLRMERDPIEVFKEYGFDIDPKLAPDKVELPLPYEIHRNLELLSRQIEATNGWIVFCR